MIYNIQVGKMNSSITPSVAPMWDRAMPGLNLRDMDGKTATECLPHLETGMLKMARNRMSYEDMGPKDGRFGAALAILVEMAHECRQNPTETIRIFR